MYFFSHKMVKKFGNYDYNKLILMKIVDTLTYEKWKRADESKHVFIFTTFCIVDKKIIERQRCLCVYIHSLYSRATSKSSELWNRPATFRERGRESSIYGYSCCRRKHINSVSTVSVIESFRCTLCVGVLIYTSFSQTSILNIHEYCSWTLFFQWHSIWIQEKCSVTNSDLPREILWESRS